MGIQGQVVLTFFVNTQGQAEDIKVVEGLWPSVNTEAILAVSELKRFKPALIDGEPVRFSFRLPLQLKL